MKNTTVTKDDGELTGEELPTHLFDMDGNPIKITVSRPTRLIPMSQLVEHICKSLSD